MSKQLTKTIMVPSTSSQASLNVAPGTVVSAPVNGDIWNEAGALKIKTPTTVKTLATTDQIPGITARTHTIDLFNYGAGITYAFEVADTLALDSLTTMIEGDWAHVLADGDKFCYYSGSWHNMGSKDWSAAPYAVGSNNELVLVVMSSNNYSTSDIVMLNMQTQGSYSAGDTVTICSSVGLSILTFDGTTNYDSDVIVRAIQTASSIFNASAYFEYDCFTIRGGSSAVLRYLGLGGDWTIEEPSALRIRGKGVLEDGFGNPAELASDGYLKRFTLNEAEYNYHSGIRRVRIKETGFGINLTGTVTDVTELNTYTPTFGQLFLVQSTNTVWAYKNNSAWYDTGLTSINFTNPPCYTDGASRIQLILDPVDAANGIGDYYHLPVVVLRADITKSHEEIVIEMDCDSVDLKVNGMMKFLDIDTTLGENLYKDGRLIAVGALNWTANAGKTHVMSNCGFMLAATLSGGVDTPDSFLYINRGSHKFVRDAKPNFGSLEYENWVPLDNASAVTLSGEYSGDGWGNNPERSRSGFFERFTLSENDFRSTTNKQQYLVNVVIDTSPFIYAVKLTDLHIRHIFTGVDNADVTIVLPDAPSNVTDIWRFYFECKCEPKFRTSTPAYTIDGVATAKPLIYSYTGNTSIDFIPSRSGFWQSTNKSTDIERIFKLDIMTTGIWANDRGSVLYLEDLASPVLGDSVYSTAYSAYFYYDGISNDVTAGWSCWNLQNPANPPYIAMTNGENRIVQYNSTGAANEGKRGVIVLPGRSSLPGSAEYEIMQYITPDTAIHVDTSYSFSEGTIILSASWTHTDWSIQHNDRNIRKYYPSIPVGYVDQNTNSGGAILLDENAHIVFEAYPDDITELPGSRTSIRWNPAGDYGTLFKRAEPTGSDGWGSSAEVNKHGMICRYTLSEREYADVASNIYLDVFTDTVDYTKLAPFDVYNAWINQHNIAVNQRKTNLVLDPSAVGDGSNVAAIAYFQMPSISSLAKDEKIIFEFKNNNGRDCIIMAASGNSFTSGIAPFPLAGIDPGINWIYVYNRPGVVCTLVRPEDPRTDWVVVYENVAGLERKGWGNLPDWSNGYPQRYSLSADQYNSLDYPKDLRISRPDNFILEYDTLSASANGFINEFSPADGPIQVETNVVSLSNGFPFAVYNTGAFNVTLKNTVDGCLIGGVTDFVIPPFHWVEFLQHHNTVRDEVELVVLRSSMYQIPTPNATDTGKAITVNSSGKYVLSTIPGGSSSRNIDGGNPFSVYLPSQSVNGGTP